MRNLRGFFDVGKIKNDEAERASAAIGAVAAVFDFSSGRSMASSRMSRRSMAQG
jgi:hypothetical protein